MTSSTAFRLWPVHQLASPGERNRWRFAVAVAVARQRQRTRTLVLARPWWNGKAVEGLFCRRRPLTLRTRTIRASNVHDSAIAEADRGADVLYEETFRVKRCVAVEGKVSVKLEWEKGEEGGGRKGQLVVGCNLDGDWTLHWGVTYCDDIASEWDQPPSQMRPAGSVPIKDYAVETPLRKSSSCSDEQAYHELKIYLESGMSVAAIHFVLKDEETGAWFQYRGRDFRIPLLDYPQHDDGNEGRRKSSFLWPSAFSQISRLILKPEVPQLDANAQHGKGTSKDIKCKIRFIEGFCKEYEILKEVSVENCINVMVKRSEDMNKNQLYIDTDIPGQVLVHWGVCRDNSRTWEIPSALLPPKSRVFRKKAIQTLLQKKEDCIGSSGMFLLDKDISGVLFVLKLSEHTWLKNAGGDFFITFKSESTVYSQSSRDLAQNIQAEKKMTAISGSTLETKNNLTEDSALTSSEISKGSVDDEAEIAYTDGIITEIRNLVSDITSEKHKPTKTKEQENILQEIEKLAAEAYRIFQSSIPNFVEDSVTDTESAKPPVFSSGTGSGYEILFQGFNWESHKSGSWYTEISKKAAELAKIGFTTVWLPPPTESVSPEGYMPQDLYNLSSRYGNMEELKDVVKRMHEVGIKVLGDVVLNHRCAHYKNQNGIWNIFGGRLNWDERAIVADDPHFQGKGNKSSGDNFHAAPNIDHSQDFVRNDIKEWLCWLREEIGYDGWRLDFARGFWGGYVKDYVEASGPYFAVGEYWDSLCYTYGQMDHNQDAHRQRIIDWINATNGTAGAFDVTTKGILHTALEKCEYWRLSDEKGKPPGVVGWWPSRAVTFIENHDTGSTQGHWRFPNGKEMQGYAYILTHPGTPTVFCDHMYSHLQQELENLISLRCKQKIHCRSVVKITKAERDVYAATIDGKLAMKIGPGYYEPPSGSNQWTLAAEGRDYKVWESS